MSFITQQHLVSIGTKIKDYFLPKDISSDPEAFTKMQLQALADKRTISKLLFYRSYIEDDTSELGFFSMHDGRLGIAFIVNPPVFLTDKTENVILNVLTAMEKISSFNHGLSNKRNSKHRSLRLK